MSQDSLIKLRCKECKQINYHSTKNKKTIKEKIKLSKHCRFCKKHTEHVEMKGK
ncbi:MAG: 50S ribosomal protein L33 [Patescibacteria group bacterium]|nr:50S ribosomal protein L33 [Patescibacteria group bacterium]